MNKENWQSTKKKQAEKFSSNSEKSFKKEILFIKNSRETLQLKRY